MANLEPDIVIPFVDLGCPAKVLSVVSTPEPDDVYVPLLYLAVPSLEECPSCPFAKIKLVGVEVVVAVCDVVESLLYI